MLQRHLTAILILLTLLVTNAFFLTHALAFIPTSFIQNKSLASTHSEMLSFLLNGSQRNLQAVLSPSEFSHIQDVRQIYIYLPFLMTFLISLTAVILKGNIKEECAKLMLLALTDLLVFFLISVPFFTIFFEYFHKILFPQGNWAFSPDSTLIQLYPESFWKTALGIIIAVTLIQLATLSLIFKNRQKTSSLSQR